MISFYGYRKNCTSAPMSRAAERSENRRLALVLQTICTTGIRVLELRFITVKAVAADQSYRFLHHVFSLHSI
ncbi:hypothetical protein ACTQ33_16300 [Candidatus Avoscillospira sp. LCP25S3_F1]|uniref:hypothetical protein n=1 Tax=Candidatus Avoscillospira sp. LCP25S3_F1 TaxID=3438825 RepID=UPI003F9181B3